MDATDSSRQQAGDGFCQWKPGRHNHRNNGPGGSRALGLPVSQESTQPIPPDIPTGAQSTPAE